VLVTAIQIAFPISNFRIATYWQTESQVGGGQWNDRRTVLNGIFWIRRDQAGLVSWHSNQESPRHRDR